MFFCLKVNEKAQVILHSCLLHMKLMLCTIQVHNWGKIHMTFDTTYGRTATRQLQAVLQEFQTAIKNNELGRSRCVGRCGQRILHGIT